MTSPGPHERLVPEVHQGQVAYLEHLLRYRFCAQFVRGRRVLDVATGSGYGAQALAQAGAALVVGLDYDPQAIGYARQHYPGPAFVVADAHHLPFPPAAFQVVVSLETIEHLERPEAFLDEVRRVLAPGGLLILSTPQKGVYPPGNPYHVREFTVEELASLLQARFPEVELWFQDLWLAASALPEATLRLRGPLPSLSLTKEEASDAAASVYILALASDAPLPRPRPHLSLGPRYSDFVLRELIRRDLALEELQRAKEAAEAQARRLQEDLSGLREAVAQLEARLSQREGELAQARAELLATRARLEALAQSAPLVLWRALGAWLPPALRRRLSLALQPLVRALRRRLPPP